MKITKVEGVVSCCNCDRNPLYDGLSAYLIENEIEKIKVIYCEYCLQELIDKGIIIWNNPYEVIINEVRKEIERARWVKQKAPFHSAHEGFAILKEEVDELWDAVKLDPEGYHTGDLRQKNMRIEAVQVAAMAIQFLLDCTKKKTGSTDPRSRDYNPNIKNNEGT